MALTGLAVSFDGLAGDGSWLGDRSEAVGSVKLNTIRDFLNMVAAGSFCRDVPIGGSFTTGLVGSAVVELIEPVYFTIDNTSSYVSGSSGLTIPITVYCRVENAAISVTPQIYNVTTAAVAATSGAAACSATATDYSGTNSIQTLLLTAAAGVNVYVCRVTPSAVTYQVFAKAWRSLKI